MIAASAMDELKQSRDIDDAIRKLKNEILKMASLTRQNLQKAVQSLLSRDIELSREVIADDSEVDELEMLVDRLGMEILGSYHPVTSDLRKVIATMKISTCLERISDHAVNIAKRARKICHGPFFPDVTIIETLYIMADTLLRDAMISFTDANIAMGGGLKVRDKELDVLHKKIIADFSALLESSGGLAESLLHIIFIVRSLERVGDLSVNIGEDAVFMCNAIDIRHLKLKDHHSKEEQVPHDRVAG
jgi:phosphate transport system protein